MGVPHDPESSLRPHRRPESRRAARRDALARGGAKGGEQLQNDITDLEGDADILHVMAEAAIGDCSLNWKRFNFALFTMAEKLDRSIKKLSEQHEAVWSLADLEKKGERRL